MLRLSREVENAVMVAIICDRGDRYLSTGLFDPTDVQARERPALPAHRRHRAPGPVGKKQRLDIERLANDGRGIAFFEGRTWFVSGALAGEEVEARVLGAHGKVVEARPSGVASAERRPAPCRTTGGCSVQHLPHDEQLALKQRMLAEQLQRGRREPEEWAAP
jgi:predicted RNA-binding protein with TRAM domain